MSCIEHLREDIGRQSVPMERSQDNPAALHSTSTSALTTSKWSFITRISLREMWVISSSSNRLPLHCDRLPNQSRCSLFVWFCLLFGFLFIWGGWFWSAAFVSLCSLWGHLCFHLVICVVFSYVTYASVISVIIQYTHHASCDKGKLSRLSVTFLLNQITR